MWFLGSQSDLESLRGYADEITHAQPTSFSIETEPSPGTRYRAQCDGASAGCLALAMLLSKTWAASVDVLKEAEIDPPWTVPTEP